MSAWRTASNSGGVGRASRPNARRVESLKAKRAAWVRKAHGALTALLFIICLKLSFSTCNCNPLGTATSSLEDTALTKSDLAPFTEAEQDAFVADSERSLESAKILTVRISRKNKELENIRRDLRHREKDVQRLKQMLEQTKKSSSKNQDGEQQCGGKEIAKLQKRDHALSKSLERATKSIFMLSREMLEIKFGGPSKEPYRARMTVVFPDSMPGPTKDDIIIEFASSNVMPVAVLFFMTQIEAGAWDGMSFIRNAGHVLQASSQTPDKIYKGERFKLRYQDGSIPFQEYSDKFPHKKYTLGLAGRPGGPDFYISTVDNTRNHGPGGQGSYDLPAEADSCFAKVVKGFNVVDRMHTAKKNHDSFEGLVNFIEIEQFKLE